MDVRLPDGTVLRNVPDGTTKDQLRAKLAANGHDIQKMGLGATSADIPSYTQIPGMASAADVKRARELAAPDPSWKDDNFLGRLVSPVDAGMSLLSGMVAAPLSVPAGFIQSAFNGKDPEKNASAIAEGLTRKPSTNTGAQMLSMLGQAAPVLQALPFHGSIEAAQGAASSMGALRGMAGANAAAMGAQDAQMVAGAPKLTAGTLADLVRAPKPAAMAGVGAAETAAETQRAQRFAQFGVKPTKGQLTRTMEDVGFEREAAKTKEGKAIDSRYAEQNAQVQNLFNDFNEQTGATASGPRATGKSTVNALELKRDAKKAEFGASYDAAEAAGEMTERINVRPLLAYLDENKTSAELAPLIKSIRGSLERKSLPVGPERNGPYMVKNDPLNQTTPLNDLEKVRQQIRAEAEPGTPNMAKGEEMIKLIDAATEGKGGPLFKQARRQFENYSNEFTNRDVVDKLLRTKPGTKDRAVAYEGVLDHAVLNGSLDDTRHLFRVLEAHAADADPAIVAAGKQAANDLRGALVDHIKEKMFSNAGANTAGDVIGSQAKIKALINELDQEGKLTAIFDKKGAQTLRDVADMSVDLYTNPPGSVNYSNTATKVEAALNKLADRTSAVPVVGPLLGPTTKYIAKKVESRNLSKKVDAALNPPSRLSDMTGGQ